MVSSTLRQNVVFVAGWVAAGLAIALLVNQLLGENKTVRQASVSAPLAADSVATLPIVVAAEADQAGSAGPPENPVTPPAAVEAAVRSYAPAVRVSAPAVVSITTQRKVEVGRQLQRAPNGQFYWRLEERLQPVLGSGVIVDSEGRIVTNLHVIQGAIQINAQVNVQLADGRTAVARILGSDSDTDLAVLKIDLPQLPVMTLGRSDRLAVGDVVLAIGNPLGLSQTVTQGIVSATGRKRLGLSTFEDFIQTDAAINKGNSGGALVNSRGELVGINTAVIKDEKDEEAEGLGLAIPVDLVRGVLQDIVKHGHVVRGWIGWHVRLYSDEESRLRQLPYSGFIVHDLAPNSTARLPGGLEIGDKVETIDGEPVRSTRDVATLVAIHKPGSTVKITGIRRDRQPFSAEVKVIDDPAAPVTQK